jgi:hypothetical protein
MSLLSSSQDKKFLEFFNRKNKDSKYAGLEKNYRYDLIIREWREKEFGKNVARKSSSRKSRRNKKSKRSSKRSYHMSGRSPTLKKSKRKSRARRTSGKCKNLLKDKIKINMDEYKSGRFKSPQQAIAVSYAQIKKYHPRCVREL